MLPPWSCQCSWDFSSVTWFQYMSDISSYYGDLDPLYIFSHYGDHDPLYIFIMEILIYVYCTWRWPLMWYLVSCLFMSIVLLCIQDCYMYLQLCVESYHCIVLIEWLVLPLGYSSLHFWDHGPMYIFIMEILIYVYCTWLWPHMWHMYHAYSWPLYSYVSGTAICICSYVQSCIIVLC